MSTVASSSGSIGSCPPRDANNAIRRSTVACNARTRMAQIAAGQAANPQAALPRRAARSAPLHLPRRERGSRLVKRPHIDE